MPCLITFKIKSLLLYRPWVVRSQGNNRIVQKEFMLYQVGIACTFSIVQKKCLELPLHSAKMGLNVSWKSSRSLVGDKVLWEVFMEAERYRFFLAAQDVFKQNKSPKHKNKDLLISASYFEIYGSKVSEKISRILNMLHFKAWEYQVSWHWIMDREF